MKAPFVIDEHLTGIALAYTNRAMIADLVLPRIGVGKQEFKWNLFAQDERYTVPDTKVGRSSRVNEVEFGATEQTDSTEDYGLEDPIPQNDIDNAFEGYDPTGHAAEALTDLILLDREVRVASLVHDPATYPANRKETLANDAKFDAPNSDPIEVIGDALDVPLMRPNQLVMGRDAFRILSRNPQIVKAAHMNDGDAGIARRAAIAELFEVEEVLVGEGFVNTAKPGQAPTFSRVWGDSIALLHKNTAVTTRSGVTFGYTAQWGGRVGMQRPDPDIGLRGGVRVRVGESVKEVITAADVGYLISSVTGYVAP